MDASNDEVLEELRQINENLVALCGQLHDTIYLTLQKHHSETKKLLEEIRGWVSEPR